MSMDRDQQHRLIRVVFKIANSIDNKGEQIQLLPLVSKMVNTTTIVTFLIIYSLGGAHFLSQNYDEDIVKDVLCVFSVLTVCLMVIGFWVEFRLYRQMGQLKEQSSLLSLNRNMMISVYYGCQISYFLVSFLFSISVNMSKTFESRDYIMIIFCSILFTIQSLISLTNRLYGMSSILIPFLFIIIDSSLSIFALLLLSSLYLYKQMLDSNHYYYRVQKMCYIIVGVTSIWAFLYLEYSIQGQMGVSIFNLAIVVVSAVGIFCFFPSFLANKSLLQANKTLFEWHKKKMQDKDGLVQQISIQEQLIYQKYLQQREINQSVCFSPKIRNAAISNWKVQERSKLIYDKISWDKNCQNSFGMNLFYFKTCLHLEVNMASLVQQMISFIFKNKKTGLDGLLYNYEIYKLNHRLFKHYSRDESNALQIADVIQAEKYYSSFYKLLNQLVTQLVHFWKEVLSNENRICRESEQRIVKIKNLQDQCECCLKKMKNYESSKEMTLFTIVTSIINNYQAPNSPPSARIIKGEIINLEYLVLEQDRINQISVKLLKSLGLQSDSMHLHTIRSFLPFNFFSYLQQMKKEYLQQRRRQFLLPIADSSGCIVMKKCCVYLVPLCGVHLAYLITFETTLTSQILILYNCQEEKIQLFNKNFKQFISIKIESFNDVVAGKSILFATDVFTAQIGQNQLAELKRGEIIKTKIVFGDFFLRKNKIFNSKDEVTLQLQYQFKFKNYSYFLIQVQSESYRQVKIEEEKTMAQLTLINRQRQSPHHQYAYQEFFCKIENPYKSKISEELSNLKSRNFSGHYYQLLLIKLIMMFLIVFGITFYHVFSSMNVSASIDHLSRMLTINNQYMHLWKLYSLSYSKYLFSSNPNLTKAYLNKNFYQAKGSNIELEQASKDLIRFYEQSLIKASKQLMRTYLLSKENVQNHNQMSFKLSFREFNLTTSTSLTPFYDFVIQTESQDQNRTLWFFAKNYNSVAHIMPVYQQYYSFVNDNNHQYLALKIVGFILISLLGLGAITNIIRTTKMVTNHRQMHFLFKFIAYQDVSSILSQLKQIKAAIGSINESNQHSNTHQHILSRPKFREQSFPQEKREQYEEQSYMGVIQKIVKYISFCLTLLATVTVIISLQYNNIVTQQADFQQIAITLQKLQTDQFYLQKRYSTLIQAHLNHPNVISQNTGQANIVKNQFYNENLPEMFANQFVRYENLCSDVYIQSINIPYFKKNSSDCEAMQLGQLGQGYSQALEFYQDYLRELTKYSLTQLLSTNNSSQSKLKEIIYIKQILFRYLQSKKDNIMMKYSTYMKTQHDQLLTIFMLSLAAWIGLIILLVFNFYSLQKSLDVVISLVLAIPPKLMSKIAIIKYIRRQNILYKLHKL